MALLAFVCAAIWVVSTGMEAHLPRLLETAGASATGAITAAALVGPAQVATRLLEFGLTRGLHPLASARLATVSHPACALALALFGGPAAAMFTVMHGAGNGMLTIAKGKLPLALFGPACYGLRTGLLSVQHEWRRPERLCSSGCCWNMPALEYLPCRPGWDLPRRSQCWRCARPRAQPSTHPLRRANH